MRQDWFTVERIHSDTFAISEYGHWEETHSYLLCGTERAVLIDTGLGVASIKAVVDGLTTLPVAAVLTHTTSTGERVFRISPHADGKSGAHDVRLVRALRPRRLPRAGDRQSNGFPRTSGSPFGCCGGMKGRSASTSGSASVSTAWRR